MKPERIPLYDLNLSGKAVKEVKDTLSSGWLTSGPKVRAFERAVASYMGVRYAAAVSSATAGLFMSLRMAGAASGREVITTPFTFIATVESILHSGARPVFADINPETLNIDSDEVARKISGRTACILPVDIAGHPAYYDGLSSISAEGSIPLIADSSHAFGALQHGKSIPKLVDAAVFSFHATKNLTCGEGGMVVSRIKPLIDKIKLLSLHSMSAGAYERRLRRKWQYDITEPGFKANLSDVHASIGLGQLAVFERNQARRAAIARRYVSNLSSLDEYVEPPYVGKGVKPAWHLFIIRLHLSRLKIDRDTFVRSMAKRGVECGVHFRPIFEFSLNKSLGVKSRHFPNTVYAGRRVVSLPMYPGLKLNQVDYVCEQIAAIVKRHGR